MTAAPPATSATARARLGGWLIRLVGPVLLGVVLYKMKDPGAVWRAIRTAQPGWLLLAVVLNLLNIHLKVVRWDVILSTRGIRYPLRKAWPAFLSSLYLGIVTPGRVGDVLRVSYLQRDLGVSRAEGLASVVVDRLCDLYVLAGFVAVGMVRYAPALSHSLVYFTWASVAGVVFGPLLFLVPGVADRVMRTIFTRLARKNPGLEGSSDVFLCAVRAAIGKPLLRTIPLTVLTFVVNYAQGWLIARSMGLPMTLYDATCLLAVASLLGLLPISISGAGVREVFFQQVFPLMGPAFTPAAGVGFGLLVFFVIYLVIAGIGFVSWQIAPPTFDAAGPGPLDKARELADEPGPVRTRVRTKLTQLATSLDATAQRIARSGGQLAWLGLYAIATGGTAYLAAHRDLRQVIETNKIGQHDSYVMAGWVGGAAALLMLVHLVVLVVDRVRRGAWHAAAVTSAVNRRLRGVLVLPFLPALLTPNIEKDSPKETLFWMALASVAVGAAAYAWSRAATGEPADAPEKAPRKWPAALGPILAGGAVLAMGVAYAVFFSRLSITNHHALNTRTTDLGIYDNIFWQSIHGKPLGCAFIKASYHGSAHFDPLLVLLSPLYLLYPRAEFLLILQSVWLATGVVPVYLLARHKVGSRPTAVAVAAMYALYPALHGANLYEFHSLTLVTPIVLWLLYFLEREQFRLFGVALAAALLCREDVSLLMCFVALYAVLSGRPRLVRAGWVTAFVSLAYFVVAKRVFMVSSDILNSGDKGSYSFAYYFDDLIPNHNGAGGLFVSLLTSPVFVLKTMFAEPKLVYLLTLFLPLCFLPFLARPGRLMLGYGFFFCLLATRSAVFSAHFQYSSILIPIAFALTPEALRRIEQEGLPATRDLDGARLRRALTAAALVASLLVSWKFGGITENQTFRGGFAPVTRALNEKQVATYAWVDEQVASLPLSASVGTTNRLGPHVSNRKTVFFYPEHRIADFVFIDEAELKGGDLDKHQKNLDKGALVLVSKHERLALYKKK